MDVTGAGQPSARQTGWRAWVRDHPFLAFVAFAYAWSWPLLVLSVVGGGQVPLVVATAGPTVAAAILTRVRGGSLQNWLRPLWRWRVGPRWWAYALGLPALLYGVVNLVLQVLGEPVNWGLAIDRLPPYLATFGVVLVFAGLLEEPGWRGFALPLLQTRFSPLVATLVLGLVWGVWHVPVYGPLGFVVPTVLAFFYTLLWNATRSVGLCVLLHASFTPAQDNLILMARDRAYTGALDAPDWAILGTYLAAALVVILATRGRLGHRSAADAGGPLSQPSTGDEDRRDRGDAGAPHGTSTTSSNRSSSPPAPPGSRSGRGEPGRPQPGGRHGG